MSAVQDQWPPAATPGPLVIFTWGNASRGDDAAGPLLHERLEAWQAAHPEAPVQLVHDFQLQIEHALEIPDGALVLFIDAEMAEMAETPRLTPRPVQPCQARSPFSHALTPAQLLAVHAQVTGQAAPRAWQLGIPGNQFELGSSLSEKTSTALEEAWRLLESLLSSLPEAA